ncbi:hypothetical protein PSSM7_049 [Prochlorococcus phage P-SSM7]|uniref:Uncharacterized protein n=1 Tax=Prochlorococcus phage P-SSM7 TaxID=445688 RepID=E3SNG7_9CAUD|nr:hypothetical protein PSSM7_049 [Prochlorococcus phage P-SSM7]ADO99054.1 hypothetical protein PSSM7_049 [Prochlorococcus phage P-SSM7]
MKLKKTGCFLGIIECMCQLKNLHTHPHIIIQFTLY